MNKKLTLLSVTLYLFAFCFIAGLQGAAVKQESLFLKLPLDIHIQFLEQIIKTSHSFESAAHTVEQYSQSSKGLRSFLLKNKNYVFTVLLQRWGITTPAEAQKQLLDLARLGPASGLAVAALQKGGATLNAEYGPFFETPLMSASREGNLDQVLLFIRAGAKVNLKNVMGNYALNAAVEGNSVEAVSLLIKVGSSMSVQCVGKDPLMRAAADGNEKMVDFLIESGADVNALQGMHYTALMFAAEKGHENIVEKLLKAGANKNQKNLRNTTASDMAATNKIRKIIEKN